MRGSSCAGLATLILLASTSEAYGQLRAWTIEPRISVVETYTDNVSFGPAASAQSDFIADISPGIRISGRGARLSASLDYAAHALFYARAKENDRFLNTLAASATLEAVENFFFVDAQGNISQTFISPFRERPAELATASENRAESRTFGLSPHVRSQLGGYTFEARNTNTWTSSENGFESNVYSQQWSGSIASPIRLFGWRIDASSTATSSEEDAGRPDDETRSVRGRVFFQPDPGLRFHVTGGRETNNYDLGQEQSYDTYGAGMLWQPTPRTSAEVDWERRFFGTSRLVSLSHRTRLSAWTVSYSKDVSSYQQELLRLPPGNTAALLDEIFRARIPDPVQRQAAVEQFMRITGTPPFLSQSLAFFTQQVLLQETIQGSVAILGVRNSIAFTAFRSRSTSLTQPLASVPGELFLLAGSRIGQRGFGASASHRLTPFTSVSASANRTYSSFEEPPGPESRNDSLSLGVSHTLSAKTSTFAGATYSRLDGAGDEGARSRSLFAGFDHRF